MKKQNWTKRKWVSRTFYFAVAWTLFVPLSVLVQGLIEVELPLDRIVGLAGAIVLTFIGGEKAINAFKASKKG